jgi:hypothetical protein
LRLRAIVRAPLLESAREDADVAAAQIFHRPQKARGVRDVAVVVYDDHAVIADPTFAEYLRDPIGWCDASRIRGRRVREFDGVVEVDRAGYVPRRVLLGAGGRFHGRTVRHAARVDDAQARFVCDERFEFGAFDKWCGHGISLACGHRQSLARAPRDGRVPAASNTP